MGGSNLTHAHSNYLICMRFNRINTVRPILLKVIVLVPRPSAVVTTNLKAPVQTASYTALSPAKTTSLSQLCLSAVGTDVVTQAATYPPFREEPTPDYKVLRY